MKKCNKCGTTGKYIGFGHVNKKCEQCDGIGYIDKKEPEKKVVEVQPEKVVEDKATDPAEPIVIKKRKYTIKNKRKVRRSQSETM